MGIYGVSYNAPLISRVLAQEISAKSPLPALVLIRAPTLHFSLLFLRAIT